LNTWKKMAIRNDLQFDWISSPRIITVLSPSVDITIQDLVDTCRVEEEQIYNLSYSKIINANGKDSLGGGVFVGITATLQNALLAFEARPGPTFVQCNVQGGNLVAIDTNNNNIDPILTTAYTQVVRTSSSSSTLQELKDIQYSSFSNGVTVDLLSLYTGTAYPIGTPRQPVNNFNDALSIANTRGFSKLFILGSALIDSGLNYAGKVFYGESITKSILTIDSLAQVQGCEFHDATIQGTLDGGSTIKDCKILDLNYVNGIIESSILSDTIMLAGDAIFLDCWSDIPTHHPVIDFNNSASALAVRGYDGRLSIINKNQSEPITIDLDAGQVTLDSTVTNGNIIIRGVGELINNSTGSAVVNDSFLLNPLSITNAILDEPNSNHLISGSIGEAISKSGLTPEQAKQLLLIFVNSL
jgi:hypothetical protein